MDPLVEYYSQRAPEYEEIYHRDDPARRAELAQIRDLLQETFRTRHVLEIACGTGFWTRIIAEVTATVLGVDASGEMLKAAQQKMAGVSTVRFESCDAYNLDRLRGQFDAGLAVFWLSHVPRGRLYEFLTQFHRKLRPGAVVVMADNMNVPGIGGEFVSSAASPDTCKLRDLKDGSKHCIIKNYYDEGELRKILAPHCTTLETHFGKAYWWTRYQIAAPTDG